MELKAKVRGLLRRKKKPKLEKEGEVPKAWLKETAKPSPSHETHSRFKPTKIKIPFLKTGKRVVAGLLLVVNVIISQATLMNNPNTQPLFLLFILNSFIILDYLWKTRRSEG